MRKTAAAVVAVLLVTAVVASCTSGAQVAVTASRQRAAAADRRAIVRSGTDPATGTTDTTAMTPAPPGESTTTVPDTNRRLLATIFLPVHSFPGPGISFDGSGQYLYYTGATGSPLSGNLYLIALDPHGARQLTSDGSMYTPPNVLP